MTKKSTLNASDVSLLIGAMKVVFPTRTDVEKIVNKKLNERMRMLPTREEFSDLITREEFNEKINRLPTKEEFFKRMDKLSGEYKKIDEAETLHAGKMSDHTDELEKLEGRIKALELRRVSVSTPIASSL